MTQIEKAGKPVQTNKHLVLVSATYLLGIFMGALDTGIVTPARTLIQNDLGVNDQLGMWMITIYTLAYAASIPVTGKLADRLGRKYVYLVCIFLFGVGSLLCGLAQDVGSFTMLLIARCIQAIGGGGIMPVATAEFGTAFPKEKRGMALGLVGGVFGIANIFGVSAGSLILDIFGANNWQYIFYINIPITVFILLAGNFVLKNNRAEDNKPIDIKGILVLTTMILSLLYGLKNLDFFDFFASLATFEVWGFFLGFLLLLPLFIFIEKRAKDPVMNLSYFTNRNIAIVLILGTLTGVVMMCMIFVPQLAENLLYIPAGGGGYLVIMLAAFAGFGSPLSGKFIDKKGSKAVLGFGFATVAIGCAYLLFVTMEHPNLVNVLVALALIGLGMGFTIGSPLNYMMLEHTEEKEASTALATLSLVRSIGTTIAPAIMIGFIAQAGMGVQDNIMNQLPEKINMPPLPYEKQIQNTLTSLESNEQVKEKMGDLEFPNLSEMGMVKIDFDSKNSDFEMPDNLINLMRNSDVTTIGKNTKIMTDEMFGLMMPEIQKEIQDGISKGVEGITTGKTELTKGKEKLETARASIEKGALGIGEGIAGQEKGIAALESSKIMFSYFQKGTFPPGMGILSFIPEQVKKNLPKETLDMLANIKTLDQVKNQVITMENSKKGMEQASLGMEKVIGIIDNLGLKDENIPEGGNLYDLLAGIVGEAYLPSELKNYKTISAFREDKAKLDAGITGMTTAITQLKTVEEMMIALSQGKLPQSMTMLGFIPEQVKTQLPKDTIKTLAGINTLAGLDSQINKMKSSVQSMRASQNQMLTAMGEMDKGILEMDKTLGQMTTLASQMKLLSKGIPAAFEEAKTSYLLEVAGKKVAIEKAYQTTMGEGFKKVYMTSAIAALFGLALLAFYRRRDDLAPIPSGQTIGD